MSYRTAPSWVSLFFLLLQGCALQLQPNDSDPLPLSVALEVMEVELHAAGPVNLGDIDDEAGKVRLKAAIHAAQCADGAPDALLPIVTGAINVAVQGSITKAGQGGITGSATPSLTYQYMVTKGQQQQITIPVTFVPVKTLPDFYLGQNLANLNGLSDQQKQPFAAELIRKRAALKEVVMLAISQFSVNQCSKEQEKKKPIFVPFQVPVS